MSEKGHLPMHEGWRVRTVFRPVLPEHPRIVNHFGDVGRVSGVASDNAEDVH